MLTAFLFIVHMKEDKGRQRTACYIDGFNLYHAINSLDNNRLKWLDLWRLCALFIDPSRQELKDVYYFSAYATWLPGPYKRHRQYIKALKETGVTVELSNFYEKPRQCMQCGSTWISHEEKQSDVKIATWMLDHVYRDVYDRLMLISRDSDIAPAITLIRKRFVHKKIIVISPPNSRHSKALARLVDRKNLKKISISHLERSLLPREIIGPNGRVIAVRPKEYE